MYREIDTLRIRQIYHLLLEMAEGKFGQQIARSGEDDDLELIVVLLNMMSEEMQHTLRFYSLLNSPDSTEDFVRKVMILDQDFSVFYMNREACGLLNVGLEPQEQLSFSSLLSRSSLRDWKEITKSILLEDDYEGTHSLVFNYPNDLTHKVQCSIVSVFERVSQKRYTIISSFEAKRLSILLEDELKLKLQRDTKPETFYDKQHVLKSEQDVRILQKVYYYILQNLHEPIPSLKELAHMFGTNENKLKYGFKQLYHTSVFRFVTAERLKKASLLIQNTDMDLKAISQFCGFKSFPHFSRAFKDKYGFGPNRLRKVSK